MRWSIVLSALLAFRMSSAQTGPGGVGNASNNVLWLSADHGVYSNSGTTPAINGQNVQQWNDRSGNGRHATQTTTANRPNHHVNVLNGHPVVRYTAANNDRMMSTGLASAERASVWVVAQYTTLPSSNPGLLQGAASGNAYANPPADKNMGMWVSSSTTQVWGRGIQSDGTQRNVTMATALGSNTPYVLNTMYRSASIDQYVDHGTAGSVATNGTLRSWTDMAIGCQAGTESWNGDIAEVVVYNVAVNDAQRIIIANYLSAKYGLTLAANDVYREDDPARGNYDHEVAGIGRINASNIHSDAQGTGIIRISNPTGLDNNEFLMWGHDNGVLGTWEVEGLPAGVQGRWGRTWRVSERNTTGTAAVDVGAVDITFDLSGAGNVDPSHLRLLVDAGTGGSFADAMTIQGAVHVGDDQYRFSGVTALVDGARFGLGTTNMALTPLPIELVSFDARLAMDGTVVLTWATAMEWENDHFTVERSPDLIGWTDIRRVGAVGHSNTLVEYDAVDREPLQGLNYYRIRQTDRDGVSTSSQVAVVEAVKGPELELLVYPNPAQGSLHVRSTGALEGDLVLSLMDASGRTVVTARQEREGDAPVHIDTGGLTPGSYLLVARSRDMVHTQRVLVVR